MTNHLHPSGIIPAQPVPNLANETRRYHDARKSLERPGVNDPESSLAIIADVLAVATTQEAAALRAAEGWGNLKLEAQLTLGQWLERMKAAGLRRGRGRVKGGAPPLLTLADLGIDRHVATEALRVAAVPQAKFREYIARPGESSFKGLMRFANPDEQEDKPSGRLNWWDGGKNYSAEWYTPAWVFQAMGVKFDLDVCSPGAKIVPWIPAAKHHTRKENGLKSPWHGFCWMNPPYGEKVLWDWVKKFVEHGNGVALVHSVNTATKWWQYLNGNADYILFLNTKIQFISPIPGKDSGGNALASVMVAIGEAGVEALRDVERARRQGCLLPPGQGCCRRAQTCPGRGG